MAKKTTTKKTKRTTNTEPPVDLVALEQATVIAEEVLSSRAAEAEQVLQEATRVAIPVIKPDSPEHVAQLTAAEQAGTLVTGAPDTGKSRRYCAICEQHFGTQSRHWRTAKLLQRHQQRPYTDPAFLAWLKRHAEIEGLAFPKAS